MNCPGCKKETLRLIASGKGLKCPNCFDNPKRCPVGLLHCKEDGMAKTYIKDMSQRYIGPDGKCYNRLNGKIKKRVGDYG